MENANTSEGMDTLAKVGDEDNSHEVSTEMNSAIGGILGSRFYQKDNGYEVSTEMNSAIEGILGSKFYQIKFKLAKAILFAIFGSGLALWGGMNVHYWESFSLSSSTILAGAMVCYVSAVIYFHIWLDTRPAKGVDFAKAMLAAKSDETCNFLMKALVKDNGSVSRSEALGLYRMALKKHIP